MPLTEWIAQYLAFLITKGDSPTTRHKYVSCLRHYVRFIERKLKKTATLANFAFDDLMQYLEAEAGRGLRPRTRYSKVSALRSFGKWLVDYHHLPFNPAQRLPLPRLDAPQRLLLSREEVAALLAACDRFPMSERGTLARAVLVTFLTTGVRRAELLALSLGDVDLSERVLTVREGKGGKSRLMPLNEDAIEALSTWLSVRSKEAMTDRLFLRGKKNALSSHTLSTLLKEVQAIAGFRGRKNQNPHSQRYFFTDQLVETLADIKTIQELLGEERSARAADPGSERRGPSP